MDLILWRHAEAGDPLPDPQADLERALSPKGERQARRVADWLNQFLPDSARVLSSPALRCLQTVAPLGRRVKKSPALAPDGDVEGLLAATRCLFCDDSTRASTAALMVLMTTAFSAALSCVHWPVPFWPALSRIRSTSGWPVSGSLCSSALPVIWIR